MPNIENILKRLDEIGRSLSQDNDALALLGLGSVGIETDRLDEYSDIDFFVIVKDNKQSKFLENTDWLSRPCKLDYLFKNSKDGFKLLYEDGIFGECAIFEESQLDKIDYSEGRIVWKSKDYNPTNITKSKVSKPKVLPDTIDYNVNEALTNLYVGLCRYRRGELLSATRFIQSYAVDGIINILHLIEKSDNYQEDIFNHDRRIEKRYPAFAKILPDFIQGYEGICNSAIKMLEFLESIYDVNKEMSEKIRELAV